MSMRACIVTHLEYQLLSISCGKYTFCQITLFHLPACLQNQTFVNSYHTLQYTKRCYRCTIIMKHFPTIMATIFIILLVNISLRTLKQISLDPLSPELLQQHYLPETKIVNPFHSVLSSNNKKVIENSTLVCIIISTNVRKSKKKDEYEMKRMMDVYKKSNWQ